MTFHSDKYLEEFMQNRIFVPPSPDLAERILRTSYLVPQKIQLSLFQLIQRLFDEFRLPQPAYALTAILLIGFAFGLGMHPPAYASEHESITITNFLHADKVAL